MNKLTRFILAAALLPSVALGYVIKETKQDEDFSLYVNDGGTLSKSLTITGSTSDVTLGPVGNTIDGISHKVFGNLISYREDVLGSGGSGLISAEGSMQVGANAYFNTAMKRIVTGGSSRMYITPVTSGASEVFAVQADVSSAAANANATYVTIASATGSGLWQFGTSSTDTNSNTHEFRGTATTSGTSIVDIRDYEATSASDGAFGLSIVKGSTTATSSQKFIRFKVNAGGTSSGAIVANGGDSAAFGTSSDQRLKKNIRAMPSQLGKIIALRPSVFDRRDMDSKNQDGFIAQELQKVYPDDVAKDENGMLMIAGWSKADARLVSAIQAQQKIIEDLQARIALLESTPRD